MELDSLLKLFSSSSFLTDGFTYTFGPISGTLVNKFGCRIVTIGGAFLASFCIFVSIFAENVIILYLTIGLGTGLGFGLIYLPAIVSVTGYFEKKRSFATGIAVCGSGLGTFLFSPLNEYLIEIYGWKGALMILSAIILNCAVFGALFRPLELEALPRQNISSPPGAKVNGVLRDDEFSNSAKENNVSLADIPEIQVSTPSAPSHLVADRDIPRNCSHSCLDSRLRQLKKTEGDGRLFSSQPLLPQANKYSPNTFDANGSLTKKGSFSGSGLLNRRDIFYRGSLLNIERYKQDPASYRSSIIRMTEFEETDSEIERAKDRAIESGLDSDCASYLLSIVGISNTVSRVALGYISDKPWVNRLYLYNVALGLCGLGTCVSIFFTTFAGQAFYAAIFGATSGAYVGLTSVVLVDLLGMEKLTNAFGVLLMFQGIASLIGPPLCGALYDMSGSYDYSFLLAGFMIFISGIMLFLLPCAKRVQARQETKKIVRQYSRA
ncbi:Monocarboxylate transporter 5 [Armadillidium nasatum]|uniref:Monocarboxylate transporter 5 n=1 Tax=Armadillidium nasatum TaxID=96803 RepID=A0A5N5SVD6_9CRUS|nr:Monocarboxylate transporter 5 [Armadillidium nasatum]